MIVQEFYGWYWNRDSRRAKDLSLHGHDADEVMGSNCAVPSEVLIRFIKKMRKIWRQPTKQAISISIRFFNSPDLGGKNLADNVVVTNCGSKAASIVLMWSRS